MSLFLHESDSEGMFIPQLHEPSQNKGSAAQQDEMITLLSDIAAKDPAPNCRLQAIRALGTFKDPRRLVLKSPPHTCRIRVLLEMFPDARFVHIMRDPYVVFPSTVKLWKSLYETHGLQKPTFAGLDEYVFETYERMYERLEEGRKLVAPGRFVELKYEDLVREPVEQMRAVYEGLQLDGFDQYRPRLQAYLQGVAGYERNRYNLTAALRDEITRRWGPIIRRYGYAVQDS